MQIILGDTLTTSLVDPAGTITGLGARIEAPVTRAIATAWTPAVLTGALWTVTLAAPVAAGDYLLVWRTNDEEPPAFEAFLPLSAVTSLATPDADAADPADLIPDVDDVGALLHARTNVLGSEVGTFNEQTLPTGDQVQRLIELAVSDISTRAGMSIPAAYAADAKNLAALQTATLVEASFFPHELDTDRSAYRQYQAMFLNGVDKLVDAVRRPANVRLV